MNSVAQVKLGLVLLFAAVGSGAFAAGDHPFETDAERVPRLKTGGSCVIRNVTIHSAVELARVGDVLVLDGKIKGLDLVEVPEGIVEINGTGRHLAPGAIDPYSHMAVDGGIDDGEMSVFAEADISDVINPDDLAIYRALTGGVTSARIVPGSTNVIGGRHEVIKLKWGRTAEEIRFPDAPEGILFATGHNPELTGQQRGRSEQVPGTRVDVEAVCTRVFERALEYRATWQAYDQSVAAGEDVHWPRRDLRLEALVGILDGDISVACHCYRADEILMFLRIAQRHGFQIGTLGPAPEGDKVAKELAAAGVPVTTFGDRWAREVEAYDAIPQNASLLDEAGVLVSLHADSGAAVQRLFPEAGKSIRYAGLDPVRALALVTLNPAKQLGISGRVGSIELGKDADLVLFTGEPLSSLSRVQWTMVDGEIEFERRDAFGLDAEPLTARPLRVERSPEIPWDPNGGETLAILGGTIHSVTAWEGNDDSQIDDGLLLIQDGRLLYVGPNREYAAAGTTLDATGKHIWPGIIALNAAFDSRARESSVGAFTVIDPDGDARDELVALDSDMLHIRVPEVSSRAEGGQASEQARAMRELLSRVQEYGDLLDGTRRIALHVRGAQAILLALKFARDQKLNAVLYGVNEGWKVADQLAAAGYPVVVGPVLAVPRSTYDPYDAMYSNAAVLFRAGVELAIQSDDTSNPRDLALQAAMACAFGLPHEEAVRAITYAPARIMGVEDRFGSLEPGKVADLIITDGDLLEATSSTDYVFIDGCQVALTGWQTRLADRYHSRPSRQPVPEKR